MYKNVKFRGEGKAWTYHSWALQHRWCTSVGIINVSPVLGGNSLALNQSSMVPRGKPSLPLYRGLGSVPGSPESVHSTGPWQTCFPTSTTFTHWPTQSISVVLPTFAVLGVVFLTCLFILSLWGLPGHPLPCLTSFVVCTGHLKIRRYLIMGWPIVLSHHFLKTFFGDPWCALTLSPKFWPVKCRTHWSHCF
jgi:hypothetical protein